MSKFDQAETQYGIIFPHLEVLYLRTIFLLLAGLLCVLVLVESRMGRHSDH